MATQNREPGLVFVDLPRGITADAGGGQKLAPFLIAIECIKKGHVCDVRHHYKDWWFDSPAVWVFCNAMPPLNYMSVDRWKFWQINEADKSLVAITRRQMKQVAKEAAAKRKSKLLRHRQIQNVTVQDIGGQDSDGFNPSDSESDENVNVEFRPAEPA